MPLMSKSTPRMLRDAVRIALHDTGAKVVEVLVDTKPAGALFRNLILKRISANAIRVGVRVEGWGQSLESVSSWWNTGIDPAMDPVQAVTRALEILEPRIKHQIDRATIARRAGLDAPLAGNALGSTAHMDCDVDALKTLVSWAGGADEARRWITMQMARHALEITAHQAVGGKAAAAMPKEALPIVRVIQATMSIPFAFDPLRPARGAGEGGGVTWDNDTVYTDEVLPDSVIGLMPGRRIADLFPESPISHRIIRDIIDTSGPAGINQGMAIIMEPALVPLDETLAALKDAGQTA